MYYKIDLDINWTTPLGYVILTEDEKKNLTEWAKKLGEDTIDLSYCSDGDDMYVEFEWSGNDILEMINESSTPITADDFDIIKRYGLDMCNGPADEVFEYVWERIGQEADEYDEDEYENEESDED